MNFLSKGKILHNYGNVLHDFALFYSYLFFNTAKSINPKPMKFKLYEPANDDKRGLIVKASFVLFMLFVLPLNLLGQQKTFTINGSVKDKDAPLPGVTVLVEGTSTGTITDASGNFTLTLSSDQPTAQVSFNYIGFKRRVFPVTLGAEETITLDVSLEEEIGQLDEVVVIGSRSEE